eukprot:243490_1
MGEDQSQSIVELPDSSIFEMRCDDARSGLVASDVSATSADLSISDSSFRTMPLTSSMRSTDSNGVKAEAKKNRNLNVSFSTVLVSQFDLALGDNPSCSRAGPPLTICWKPCMTKIYQVDIFEANRVHCRRYNYDLRIDPVSRHTLLRRKGEHSIDQIFERMDEMEKIRISRRRSYTKYRMILWFKNLFR